jgi:hypothetical protein
MKSRMSILGRRCWSVVSSSPFVACGLALGAACVRDPGRDIDRRISATNLPTAERREHSSWPSGARIRVEATTQDASDLTLRWVWTEGGWKLADLPFDVYAADTPGSALRALSWAVALKRWDVVVSLAPARFRQALSPELVEAQWTKEPSASHLREALAEWERSRSHVIFEDQDMARFALPSGRSFVLEREEQRWVVASVG